MPKSTSTRLRVAIIEFRKDDLKIVRLFYIEMIFESLLMRVWIVASSDIHIRSAQLVKQSVNV